MYGEKVFVGFFVCVVICSYSGLFCFEVDPLSRVLMYISIQPMFDLWWWNVFVAQFSVKLKRQNQDN